ncbi:putative ATPase [Kribbella amoyensis]|uniref:Putative ATPase n=1 Tax=Kribbella amoyensis TaxID=996641 RepID=A0A561B8R9_9ACTN|nr:LuxR C-terminal-related transcriptional regulator [Kribbella amoyensis]TWD75361.1 putative ATPase [Kribbella amoyensis]
MAGPREVSAREAEVLAALAGDRSNAQIARRLQISVRTVESHVSSLLRKYGVTDRRELARLAEVAGSEQTEITFTGLPNQGTSFVGRERERAEVIGALGSNRLVSLLGPGGVGKTRLALQVAAELGPRFPYGGAVVDLVPVRPGFVVAAVAAALGVAEQPPQEPVESLLDRLRLGRTLLVVDNCEHLVEEVGVLLARILAQAPETTLLVTSRERIGVVGERSVGLGPLALGSDAEQLFADRVPPEFAIDPQLAADVCAGLDGVPLAIELAAARAGSLGPDGLLAALDDRLRLLAGGRGPDERHRSLAQVIGWSYALLDEAERAVFRRLAVFVGGFDLDAAVAVNPSRSRGEVSDLLGRLTDKSLLRRGQQGAVSRWRMLETVRAFAAEELAGSGEAAEATARHLAWALGTVERLELRLTTGEWEAEFDQVTGDLRAALTQAALPKPALPKPAPPKPALTNPAEQADEQGHRLARGLAHLTFARQRFVEAREHYLTAADLAASPAEEYEDLRDAAEAALVVANGGLAYQLLRRAAELDDERLSSDALALAVTAVNRYDVEEHQLPDRGAALLATKQGDTGSALTAIARAWVDRPELAPAEAAVAAARSTGDALVVMSSLDAYCVAAASAGRLREARRAAEERLALAAELPRHDPRAVAEIVDAFHVASTTAVSVGALTEAVRLARGIDDPVRGHPYITAPRRIRAFALSGFLDEAVREADIMWTGWRAAGCPPAQWMASAAASATLAHGLLGDGQAPVWRQRALELARVGDAAEAPALAAPAAFVDARLALHLGTDDAEKVVARTFEDFFEPWWVPYAQAAGAELAIAAGLPDPAQYLELVTTAGENDWAAATLLRARGRLTGDEALLTEAASRFEGIGARFEYACTLLLLGDDRAAEDLGGVRPVGW